MLAFLIGMLFFNHGGKGGSIGLDSMNYWVFTWQGTNKCSGWLAELSMTYHSLDSVCLECKVIDFVWKVE